MRGQITQLIKKDCGFVRGIDGKMYWFGFYDGAKSGDIVEFEGAEDEKGYLATQMRTVDYAPML